MVRSGKREHQSLGDALWKTLQRELPTTGFFVTGLCGFGSTPSDDIVGFAYSDESSYAITLRAGYGRSLFRNSEVGIDEWDVRKLLEDEGPDLDLHRLAANLREFTDINSLVALVSDCIGASPHQRISSDMLAYGEFAPWLLSSSRPAASSCYAGHAFLAQPKNKRLRSAVFRIRESIQVWKRNRGQGGC